MYKLNNEAEFTGGDPSTLGYLTGNAPNLFFKESANQEISKNTFSFTGKAGLQYKFNEYGNVFANYSRGRRPNVLQFTSTGEEQILDAEISTTSMQVLRPLFLKGFLSMLLVFTRNTKIFRAVPG